MMPCLRVRSLRDLLFKLSTVTLLFLTRFAAARSRTAPRPAMTPQFFRLLVLTQEEHHLSEMHLSKIRPMRVLRFARTWRVLWPARGSFLSFMLRSKKQPPANDASPGQAIQASEAGTIRCPQPGMSDSLQEQEHS
eukprot:2648343-Amphidinium_carterae.1